MNDLRAACDQPQSINETRDCAKVSKRPKQDYLKDYDVNIHFCSVGCVISVGCKSIPFTSVKEGMESLNAYVNDPATEIAKWNKIFEEEF